MAKATIWLALGGNVNGAWGRPEEGFARAIQELRLAGFSVAGISHVYVTAAVSPTRQPDFRNAAVGIRGSVAPAALLRFVKRLEARSGRRSTGRWARRPLDIDVIDFGGRILGSPTVRRRHGQLILPHPELAKRGFVLVPLAEIAPGWRHPSLGIGARDLLRRNPRLRKGVRLGTWPPALLSEVEDAPDF